MIRARPWCWSASGKHPAAADYIRLGGSNPLLDAVSDWVAKGYDELLRVNGRPQIYHSWRFWLRGVRKGDLICGLGLDSSDRIGRPYPLMIMGEGMLKGWEKNWTKLPDQLSRVWQKLEYIASRRYDDARAMEEEIGDLNAPAVKPQENPHSTDEGSFEWDVEMQVQSCRSLLLSKGFGVISLSGLGGDDADRAISHCHRSLAGCCKDIPRGVFMGGTPQQTFLCVIDHPLATSDFIQLWTM